MIATVAAFVKAACASATTISWGLTVGDSGVRVDARGMDSAWPTTRAIAIWDGPEKAVISSRVPGIAPVRECAEMEFACARLDARVWIVRN